jgi:hypothetical protein
MSYGFQVTNASNEVAIDTAGRSLFVVSRFSIANGQAAFTYSLPSWCRYMTAGWTITKESTTGEVPAFSAVTQDGYPKINIAASTSDCSVTVFAW